VSPRGDHGRCHRAPAIDVERRAAIRRNHTGTHVLHWALRAVLGEHVKQAGSYVGPDRLRFDFSHYAAVTDDEIAQIERSPTARRSRTSRSAFETTKDEAERLGAIAFFGDKYGDMVRVLEAGSSVELCGGTHVRATGDIGTIKIVSEASIGSNLRRIEAITGGTSVELLQRDERMFAEVGRSSSGATPDDVVDGVQRKLDEIKALHDELKVLPLQLAGGPRGELAPMPVDGVVVERVDDLAPATCASSPSPCASSPVVSTGCASWCWVGVTPPAGVARGGGAARRAAEASDLLRDAAKAVGGGGGGKGDIATAGGKDPSASTRRCARTRGRHGVTRALGVDLGSKRIGLAVSDRSGTIASPLGARSDRSRGVTTSPRSPASPATRRSR
jgi:alanyl-tRNA synthetase